MGGGGGGGELRYVTMARYIFKKEFVLRSNPLHTGLPLSRLYEEKQILQLNIRQCNIYINIHSNNPR